MKARRGYQGKRFKVEDYENECTYHLSADEFQLILWFSEKKKMEAANAGQSREHNAMPEVQLNDVL